MDGNWAPARVRRNFRIDLTSVILGGAYISVVVTFMPIVVRRMGGSPSDVALVVAAPFIGHLLSPLFTFLFAGVRPVRVTAGTATASRVVFLAGVLVAAAIIALPGAISFFWIRYDPVAVRTRRPIKQIAQGVWADRRYRRLLLAATVFGTGNLMNVAIFPIMLVDHFDASNSFVGAMMVVQSATMIVAYLVWGRIIDRGSSIRLTLVNTVVTILVPIGYIAAPATWALLPVAAIAGIVTAGGELTFFTNIVQLAPRERIGEYAAAQ